MHHAIVNCAKLFFFIIKFNVYNNVMFEWMSYDQFNDIKELSKVINT
jgi:hypothetical protein